MNPNRKIIIFGSCNRRNRRIDRSNVLKTREQRKELTNSSEISWEIVRFFVGEGFHREEIAMELREKWGLGRLGFQNSD